MALRRWATHNLPKSSRSTPNCRIHQSVMKAKLALGPPDPYG